MKIKNRKHSEVIFSGVEFKQDEDVRKLATFLEWTWLNISVRSLRVTFVNCYVAPGLSYKVFKKSDNKMLELLAELLPELENDKSYATGKAEKKK